MLNERVQHDLQDMGREFQLEKERKQLHVMRGLLRKAFPEVEVRAVKTPTNNTNHNAPPFSHTADYAQPPFFTVVCAGGSSGEGAPFASTARVTLSENERWSGPSDVTKRNKSLSNFASR